MHDQYRGNARSPLALIHLGLALKLMGDETRAKQAFDDAFGLPYGIQPADDRTGWGEWLGDYGSRIRDQALAYALMVRHAIADPRRENLLLDLAADFERRRYFSTQERLALFLAARGAGGNADQAWSALLQVGAEKGADRSAESETLSAKATEQRSFDAAALKRGITITSKTPNQPLFVEVSVQGYPVKPLPPRDDRISIERSWWTTDGRPMTERRLKTGDMLIVRLRVNAKQRIKDGLVIDRFPAGLEVENVNLAQGAQLSEFTVENVNIAGAMNDARIKHREYRDDRFVVAADLDGRTLDAFYIVRVVTPGRFVVPAPFAEDMYRPDVRGVGKAEADIEVVDPRGK